jgi:N-acetylmuramoyl-L-alanine amidase
MLGTTTLHRKSIAVLGALALTLTSVVSASASDSYEIQPGDTLTSIAGRAGISVDMLAQMNGIQNPNLIFAGQRIALGTGQQGGYADSAQASTPVSDTYTVQPGDTLWSIAGRFGITVAQLVEANRGGVSDQNLIYAGQQLVIPGGVGSGGMVQPASPQPESGGSQFAPSGDVGSILHDTAVAYGLDPALVKAVAWQESGWQQHVVSSSGALGVMQVMPATGGWISSELVGRPLDIQGSVPENVLAGVVYLEWLLRYTGDENQALASYYQGPGSVSRIGWYDDTHSYVASVQAIRSHIHTHGVPPR